MKKKRDTIFCKGKVKFYDSSKNHFGFIEAIKTSGDQLNEDIYFKKSGLRDSSKTPGDGENIYCYAKKGHKGFSSNDVILEGELKSVERLRYVDFLHLEDLSALINEFYDSKSDSYKDKITSIYNAAITHSSNPDPSIWRFLYEYSPQKNKAALQSHFEKMLPANQFKVALHIDELLKQAFELNAKIDLRRELQSVIPKLYTHDKIDFITDKRWTEYLKNIRNYHTLFKSLEDGFKIDVTLKHYAWSTKDIEQLLMGIDDENYTIKPDLLSRIFEEHIETIIPDFTSSALSFQSTHRTFKTLLKQIFSLNQQNELHAEFTEIFINYLTKKGLENSIQYLTDIFRLSNEEVNENLIDFKDKVFDEFRTNLAGSLSKDIENQIIAVYDSLKEIGLQDVADGALSRPSKIELHLSTGKFDLDLKNDYKYLNQLSFEAQREFFKRMLKTVSSDGGGLFWSIIDNMQTDILSPEEEKGYDPSTVFCIYILLQIKGESSLSRNPLNTSELFKFVYGQLTDPVLIEHKLTSYFELCSGRAYPKKSDFDRWEIRRTKESPCNYCEGQIMIDQKTQDPLSHIGTKREKYWCRNSICLSPVRHEPTEGMFFSEMLSVLGYSDVDYFTGYVNGWVNKINTYLKHLKCKECNGVLRPTDIGTGYYRVSYFKCTNHSCVVCKNDETIYLTHCINPKCEEVIDSRYTRQCDHGWYICRHCYGCCSTEKIQNRIKYYDQINKPYKGATVGHKELGEIFCPDCGKKIKSGNDGEKYQRMLAKFKNLKNKHPNIIKYGRRDYDGKSWFLLKKMPATSFDDFDQKIMQLAQIGFNLGEDYYKGTEVALISEQSQHADRVLTCQNCKHQIDINEMYQEGNYYRAKAIEKWHPQIFK